MANSKLNPKAAPFVPKYPLMSAMLAYMNDEFIFTNTTVFKDILGRDHEYTNPQIAEIDDFIARGVKEGYFHEVKDGIYRALWKELERRAELMKLERRKIIEEESEALLEE